MFINNKLGLLQTIIKKINIYIIIITGNQKLHTFLSMLGKCLVFIAEHLIFFTMAKRRIPNGCRQRETTE